MVADHVVDVPWPPGTALASTVHNLSKNMDRRLSTDLVQLYLLNAFDSLDHSILLRKVELARIRGPLLKCISNFICDRSQGVVYQGSTSRPFLATSGVPQGSVLGPTLLLIHINNMPHEGSLKLVQYADNTTILAPIPSPSTGTLLQSYLNRLELWARENHLRPNARKSFAMHVGPKSRHPIKESYCLSGGPIETVDSLEILGITLSCHLDFHLQVTSVVNRARLSLGFVTRVTRGSTASAFTALYTALVLPHLEFCSAVWAPHQSVLLDRLEGVQRRASRTVLHRMGVPFSQMPSYEDDRLASLHWRPLA